MKTLKLFINVNISSYICITSEYEALSSRVLDARFSFWKQGFDSPTGYRRSSDQHTKACKLNVCGLFVFYSILIHSIIHIKKTVSNSVSQFLAYLYSLKTL